MIELINNSDIKDVKVKKFGYNDCFIKHGSVEEIEELNGLSSKIIVENL